MKKLHTYVKAVFFVLVSGLILFSWERAATYQGGPPAGYTNAPSEGNCTSCHSGSSFNSSSSIITMKVNSGTKLEYYPDTTYTIEITVSKSGVSKFGFQVTALDATNNKMAGTFTITNSSTTQSTSTSVGGNTRYYVQHTSGGTSGSSGSITWKFNWKAPSTNVGDIKFYVVANTTNSNSGSSGDVIYGNTFTFKALNVNAPVPTISYTPAKPCEGDTVYFSGSATNNPTSYSWSFQNGTPSTSTSQNAAVVFSTWGSFKATLSATNPDGTGTTSTTVSLAPKPSDLVTVNGNTTLCQGDSVQLIAPNGTQFLWSTGETGTDIYVKQSGSYTVEVTNTNGCSRTSKPVDITVNQKPVVTLNRLLGADSVCVGDSVKFEALPAGLASYRFYNGQQLIAASTSNIYKFKPNGVITSYNIRAIGLDSAGCMSDSSNSFSMQVHKQLSFPFGLKVVTASTGSLIVEWDAVPGALGYEVSADTGKTWQSTTNTHYTVTGLLENTFVQIKVRATDNSACMYGKESGLVAKTQPCSELQYQLTYDQQICPGDMVNIVFSQFSSTQFGIRTAAQTTFTKDTAYQFMLTKDSTIEFFLYDSLKSNCDPFSVTVPVTLYTLPPLNGVLNQNEYCEGEAVSVTASSGFTTYEFYLNNTVVNTSSSRTYAYTGVADGDEIMVKATTVNGCSRETAPVAVKVNAKPAANFSYNIDMSSVQFSFTGSGATGWEWDFADGNSSMDENPEHSYKHVGTYMVRLIATNDAGCRDTIEQEINVETGSIADGSIEKLNIYPVPFGDQLTLELETSTSGMYTITMADMMGRVVWEKNQRTAIGSNLIHIPADHIVPGIYYLNIRDSHGMVSRQVLKY